MIAGRNDPCPCGSGKKYKKCCLVKHEARASAGRLEPPPGAPGPPQEAPAPSTPAVAGSGSTGEAHCQPEALATQEQPATRKEPVAGEEKEPDPHMEAIERRWDEFEAADFEGRVDWFLKTLDEPELMDDEMAFGMTNRIVVGARKRGAWDRVEMLIRALQERLPEVYAESRLSYLTWLVDAAIARRRFEGIETLTRQIAACAHENVDVFNLCLDPLAYHGQLDALVEMLRAVWPKLKDSGDIMPWALDEFLERAARYEVLQYCQQCDSPRGDDPQLIDRLRRYCPTVHPEPVVAYVDSLTGRVRQGPSPEAVDAESFVRPWFSFDEVNATDESSDVGPCETPPIDEHDEYDEAEFDEDEFDEDDCDEDEVDQDEEEPVDLRAVWCARLGEELVGHLDREEGVPLVKGTLAAQNLAEYLIQRRKGKLKGSPELYDPGDRPQARKGKARRRQVRPIHVLCPDAKTLEPYFAGQLRFLSARYHRVAATMEAIPAWLRFLRSRGLIDASEEDRTLEGVAPVHRSLVRLWKGFHEDPALHEAALRTWPRKQQQDQQQRPAGQPQTS